MAGNGNARKRAPSIQQTIHNIEGNKDHHLTGSFMPNTPTTPEPSIPNGSRVKKTRPNVDFDDSTKGLWNDIRTLRWMKVPSSSFKLMIIPVILYAIFSLLNVKPNPFAPLLFISHRVPTSAPEDPRYAKGWLDLAFIAYHIIVFSFIRQFTLFEIFFPIARKCGINKPAKMARFGEQAYAVLYYGAMGLWGIYIMSSLPTWWYKTEYYWIDYPHWDMKPLLKRYYLMHLSYWIQQLIVLVLRIEKPRSDFKELAAHHVVTLWLIGWSYGVNLTLIGNAIFVSMDIPDAFFATSKLCNYLGLETTKLYTFAVFIGVWTYFRHYLNIVILHSVWTQFKLIPDSARFFKPPEGVWMVWWMKYQIFIPIFALQLINLFWYYLILRVAYRALTEETITDIRSDEEDDGDEKEE